MADITASTTKLMRHEVFCTSHAKGVPVNNMPKVPTVMATPDTAANFCAGKYREINTVQARKAGEQPTPISA